MKPFFFILLHAACIMMLLTSNAHRANWFGTVIYYANWFMLGWWLGKLIGEAL